jgi:hypothetical protein
MTVAFADPISTTSRFGPDGAARNGRGQYLVLPPSGKKPIGYSRASNLAKVTDDVTNLTTWKVRSSIVGMVARPDIYALAQVTDADDKTTLNDLAEQALEAGGTTVRRNQGTALHAVFEKHWTDPGWKVPASNAGDVTAVEAELARYGFELCGWHEVMVVNDAAKIAGTFDLLIRHTATGHLFIADLKTGGSVDFGGLSFAIQFYIYASATCAYRQGEAVDGSLDERIELPVGIDQDRAILIHVQPGSAHCDLHWVDLAVGRDGFETALAVKAMRSRGRKALIRFDAVDAAPAPLETVAPLIGDRRTWLVERVRSISAAEASPAALAEMNVPSAAFLLAGWWPEGVPYLATADDHTDVQLDAIAERCSMVEKALALSFPEIDPVVETANARVSADDPRIVDVRGRLAALPVDIAVDLVANIRLAGFDWVTSGRTSEAGLLAIAELIDDTERVHALRLDVIEWLFIAAGLGDPDEHRTTRDLVCVLVAGVDVAPVGYTAADVALLELVLEALVCGYLGVTDTGIVATDACEALLITVFGDRRKTLSACKRACKAHGFDAPSKFVDVLAHPILIALTVGAPETDTATPAAL